MKNDKLYFAIISDIHFDENNAERLSEELEINFLNKLNNDIDIIFIAGDLFHKKVSLDGLAAKKAINFIYEILKRYSSIPLRIIQGTQTHDYNMLEVFRFLENDDKYNFRIINNCCSEDFELNDILFDILYIPEEYPKDWREYYSELMDIKDPYFMTIGHGMIDFASHSSVIIESEKPIKNAPVFPSSFLKDISMFTVFGHVHVAQNNDNIYYCGSFSRMAYGEENPKGWVLVEYDINYNKFNPIRIENDLAPKYNTVKLSTICSEKDPIEDFITKVEKLTKKCNLRIKIDLVETSEILSKLSVLRERFVSSNKINIHRTTIKNKELNEDTEDDGLNYIRTSNLPTEEIIHLYLEKEQPNLDIKLNEVKEIISLET